MSKSVISVLVIIAVMGGIFFLSGQSKPVETAAGGDTIFLSLNPDYTYKPQVIKVKAGTKVRIEGDPEKLTGTMDTIIVDGYEARKKISAGDNVLEFVADKTGEYKIHCANNMGNGKLIVI